MNEVCNAIRAIPEIETKGNARLIAAAPELLAALQALDDARMHTTIKPIGGKVMDVVAIHREVFDAAIAAIAKATGSAA